MNESEGESKLMEMGVTGKQINKEVEENKSQVREKSPETIKINKA